MNRSEKIARAEVFEEDAATLLDLHLQESQNMPYRNLADVSDRRKVEKVLFHTSSEPKRADGQAGTGAALEDLTDERSLPLVASDVGLAQKISSGVDVGSGFLFRLERLTRRGRATVFLSGAPRAARGGGLG